MWATVLVLLINLATNLIEKYSDSIWLLFLIPVKGVGVKMIMETVIGILNSAAETFLLCYTADNIDYK